jgi:hypothetical protein
MEQWAAIIINGILSTVVLAIVKTMMGQMLEQVMKRLDKSDEQTQNYQRELLEFKLEVSHKYVQRDDFLRVTSIMEAKMDALNAKLDALMLATKKEKL